MSNGIRHDGRFAEVEYCLQSYFDTYMVAVMQDVKDYIGKKQAEETSEYAMSPAGLLGSLANGTTGMPDNTLRHLRLTGEWNSKTAEDYMEMCRERIAGNEDIASDLTLLAGEWRNAVVTEIGRERYDSLSARLGGDLAFAYVDYRMEQLMIDHMVAERMPKSSVEYVLRKGMEGSLFGFADSLMKSPLQQEIDARSEAAYKPSKGERAAGRGVSLVADAAATGGITSWTALAGTLGLEAVSYGVERYIDGDKKGGVKVPTVEECISRGVFGAEGNVFTGFRQKGKQIVSYENDYVLSVNSRLVKPMGILTEKPLWADYSEQYKLPHMDLKSFIPENKRDDERYKDVPMIVAPGHEEEYLRTLVEQEEAQKKKTEAVQSESEGQHTGQQPQQEQTPESGQNENQQQTNESGWDSFLRTFGLDGLDGVGKNLGYVVSMLPDVLIGLFTGNTKSFGVKDSLLPVASILLGMFVRNPLLKMVLIGMGGSNLLNKAGQEALDKQEETPARKLYKPYPDEQLNARLANPVLQGDHLFMEIDGVPCSVLLPHNAAEACREGALPINTLANAVLAKHEQTKRIAQGNFRASEQALEEGRERTFGIK